MTQKIMINTDKTKKRRIFLKIIFNHKQSALSALYLFVQICLWFPAFSQNLKFDQSDNAIEARLKNDVSILASDSFLGRQAGTQGELMARDYIISQLYKTGLKPLFGDTSYIQPFDANGGASRAYNMLEINGQMFNLDYDFYPVDYTANAIIEAEVVKVGYGILAPELNYNDYLKLGKIRDKIFVLELYISDSLKKITGFEKYQDIKHRIKIAIDNGAMGIIIINSAPNTLNPPQILSNNANIVSVPVIFANKKAAKMIRVATNMKAKMETSVSRKKAQTAYNVGGYLDNKAKFTVVFGAHYDHLGYNEDFSKKIIYNGADDNASGTAAMIELARFFSDTAKENYNLIFLAFSAEEKGLIGSKYFVESNAVNLMNVAFMINC
ncbi:MAG: M28 family peptidase, partial [Bacteroidetes bacterium]|nr:M28 family peptidase [Bacteroidota bacterium]